MVITSTELAVYSDKTLLIPSDSIAGVIHDNANVAVPRDELKDNKFPAYYYKQGIGAKHSISNNEGTACDRVGNQAIETGTETNGRVAGWLIHENNI
jgi:hypothetical protein